MKKGEYQQELAEVLKNLRIEKDLKPSQIAQMLYIDPRTWANYESGITAPTVPEFLRIFDELNADVLKETMNVIYPDIYKELDSKASTAKMRKAAIHYWEHIATDRMLREWNFVCFGGHGSNIEPQLAEFVMLDSLPMDYRYIAANTIYGLYKLAKERGELLGTDIKPDVELFLRGLAEGRKAAVEHRNSYTTITED